MVNKQYILFKNFFGIIILTLQLILQIFTAAKYVL